MEMELKKGMKNVIVVVAVTVILVVVNKKPIKINCLNLLLYRR